MRNRRSCVSCIFLLILWLVSIQPAAGGDSPLLDISVTDGGYAPQVTLITVGTSVEWTCYEGVHTVTSTDGLWDSGVLVPEQTFSYTFDSTGVFRYYDTLHLWPRGTVQVVSSSASIDIWTDRTAYASGDTIRIGVDLENPGGAVQAGIGIWAKSPAGAITVLGQKPSVTLPGGFSYTNDEWLVALLPPLPRGCYSLNAALVKQPEVTLISRDREEVAFGEAFQDDWSGGPGAPGPGSMWGNGFDTSSGVAWRSIPGQLSLSSEPRPNPIESTVAFDADKPSGVATGDVNGDGKTDIITADPIYNSNPWLGSVDWWQREENGTWTRHTIDGDFYGAEYAGAADVDSDGDLDVLSAAYYGEDDYDGRNGRFAWFENLNGDGSSWQKHLVGDMFWGGSYIDAGDIDGDGDIDLAGASQLTDGIYEQESDITWFENLDGRGHFWGQHDLDLDFPNASEAHIADLDGDGDMDIVGANSAEIGYSQFAWWRNENGDGSEWTKIWVPYEFSGAGYVGVGDLDGDGDLDLMGSGYNTGSVGWWENLDGLGTSWAAWYVTPQPTGRGLDIADIDGDGDMDAISWNVYWIIWLENDGTGFGWTHRTIAYGELPWAAAGDLDDDGKLDVVIVSEENGYPPDDQMRSYDLTEFAGPGELTGSILDGGPGPGWGTMTWEADVPEGASLSIDVRASDDPGDPGSWVSVPSSGSDLGDLVDPDARYLQYRASLSSDDPEVSPVIRRLAAEIGEGSKAVSAPNGRW